MQPPLRVRQDDAQYQQDLVDEAAFFDRPQFFGPEGAELVPKDDPIDQHNNRRLTGDPLVRWYETIARYGSFRRGMFLGVSGVHQERRILETNPALEMEFIDASPESLALREQQLGRAFAGRVRTRVADLNFIELPERQYDVIVSSSALHHIQNIEHVAAQVNRALVPGGYFFLQDYVAEERFQFSDTKKRVFEAFLAYEKRRGLLAEATQPAFPPLEPWEHSPFEAIRSSDTLDVLASYLEQVSVRTTGAMTGLVVFVPPAGPPPRGLPLSTRLLRPIASHLPPRARALLPLGARARIDPRFLADLLLLDDVCCDSGIVQPYNAFAVYRKKS
ncbi:MAG TPA: class I SAM-dependent methyltransferase [Dehalococcoidia bacterium]|jgi:SAM-dependent methyltransferase|nr:class I SAM-dependent methyltransferase [Dehalococcoidia bacterium]